MNVACVVELLLDGDPETIAILVAILFLPVKRGRPVLGTHHPDVVKGLCQHHNNGHLERKIWMENHEYV